MLAPPPPPPADAASLPPPPPKDITRRSLAPENCFGVRKAGDPKAVDLQPPTAGGGPSTASPRKVLELGEPAPPGASSLVRGLIVFRIDDLVRFGGQAGEQAQQLGWGLRPESGVAHHVAAGHRLQVAEGHAPDQHQQPQQRQHQDRRDDRVVHLEQAVEALHCRRQGLRRCLHATPMRLEPLLGLLQHPDGVVGLPGAAVRGVV